MARQCMVAAIRHKPEVESMTLGKELQQLKPPMLLIGGTSDEVKCEDLVKITIGDDLEKFFQVGSQIPQQEREELVEFLK